MILTSSPGGHRETRSENGLGGRPERRAAEAVITGTDESRNTGDESPGGSRKVGNPHTWPVCAKIAKISGGNGEPTQDGAIGWEHQPTQANAGDRCGWGEQAASPDEVYLPTVDGDEAARTTAVVLSRRLWHPPMEVSITICASLSVLECVVERGEVLELPLDSRVVVPNFSDIFHSLVMRENAKLCTPTVASKVLVRPCNAVCFPSERRPMSYRDGGSVAYIGNGPHGAVGLFLRFRSAKTIDAGVAVHPQRAGAVLHGVPVGEEDRWSGEFREHVTHDGFHARRERKFDALLE